MPDINPQSQQKKLPRKMKKKDRSEYGNSRLFMLIMEYRESKFYQWIKKHPEVAIAIVGLWGMLILIMFLWFVITRVVQQ
jgi:hypothetical protein